MRDPGANVLEGGSAVMRTKFKGLVCKISWPICEVGKIHSPCLRGGIGEVPWLRSRGGGDIQRLMWMATG